MTEEHDDQGAGIAYRFICIPWVIGMILAAVGLFTCAWKW